jgi:hypothetical protein
MSKQRSPPVLLGKSDFGTRWRQSAKWDALLFALSCHDGSLEPPFFAGICSIPRVLWWRLAFPVAIWSYLLAWLSRAIIVVADTGAALA